MPCLHCVDIIIGPGVQRIHSLLPLLRSFGASGVRFGGEGFVEVLAATQTPTDKEWFQVGCSAVAAALLFPFVEVPVNGVPDAGSALHARRH